MRINSIDADAIGSILSAAPIDFLTLSNGGGRTEKCDIYIELQRWT